MEVCTQSHRLCKATHMPLAREGYLDRYMKAIYFLRKRVARDRFEIRQFGMERVEDFKCKGYPKRYNVTGEGI